MFDKTKSSAALPGHEDFTVKPKRAKRKRPDKWANCKRCWGFCDFLKTSWKLFKEFSADTSIHGIKYLTDKKLHWSEKLFWAIALTLSILACSYLIYDTYRKWQMAPVIVSFAEKSMNIWEIPFPAITICPIGGVSPLNDKYNVSDHNAENPLKNFTGVVDERITSCKWRNDAINASELFTEVATEEGFCFTFNSLNFGDLFEDDVAFEAFENLKNQTRIPPTRWSLQKRYTTQEPNVHPQRAAGSGENGGLQFEIWRKIREVKRSTSFNKGFKLVLHLPNEVPQFDKHYFRFPLEKFTTLVIRPTFIDTEELQDYDVHLRQCYYENEMKLQLFKKYTRSNCQLECLAEQTRKECGCIPFSMPRKQGDKVCDSEQSQSCFTNAKKQMMRRTMEDSLRNQKRSDDRGEIMCGCLPPCKSLKYEGEISYDDIRYFGKYRNTAAFRSSVTIFFKDDDFTYSKRSEMYSSTDFIANFGGILGLFLGVSILSIVEIIYFMAFRQLDDNTEHPSRRGSFEDDTTIASVEIKADETSIARNGY